MEISAISNAPDIVNRPKLNIVPGNIQTTDSPQVLQQGQGLPENRENIDVRSELINKAIERANKTLAEESTKLAFSIHERTKEIMVKVVDTNTGEIIREIPPEKLMDRLATVLENIGWLVDEKV